METQDLEKKKKRRVVWGVILIVVPILALPVLLSIYAIFSFVAIKVGGENWIVVASIVRVLLGLCGVLSILGMFVGIPVGIYLLVKKN